jgi:hypothetical protein
LVAFSTLSCNSFYFLPIERDDDPKGKVIQSDGLLFTRKAVLAGAFMSLEEVYAAVKVRRNLR